MTRLTSRPRGGFFFALILAAFTAFVTIAPAATLLPNGKQQFIDANGAPLSLGSVQFFVPGTTTPKPTWQNSTQTILNNNPVALDASGQAVIYGAGAYRQVVKDRLGNVLWDAITADTASAQIAFGGTSAGTANFQTVTAPNFTSSDGQIVTWKAGSTNTAALSLVVSGVSVIVLKDTPTGPVNLSGGEVVGGNDALAIYDSTLGAFHLINNAALGATPVVSLTSAPTTDLGATGTRYVNITGSSSITSFGSAASVSFPFYTVTFGGSSTLTNSASLILPGAQNLVTSNGDSATLLYQGAGVWKVLSYSRASLPYAPSLATALRITNNATTPNSAIDVSAATADISGAPGNAVRFLSVAVTVSLTTIGANGLDVGAVAASTWYNIYLISNGATVAGLASASATSPTLPTGYIYAVRVGAMQTDASSVLYRTLQRGKDAQYVVTAATNTASLPLMSPTTGSVGSVSVPTWVARPVAPFAPPTATRFRGLATSNGAVTMAAPNASYGASNSTTNPPPFAAIASGINVSTTFDMELESASIFYATSGNYPGGSALWAIGWQDAVPAN